MKAISNLLYQRRPLFNVFLIVFSVIPVAGGMTAQAEDCEGYASSDMVNTVWQWIQTLYNDDRKIAPDDPKNYTVQFLEDGKLNVKTDCNMKGGKYSIQDKTLVIEIMHSTMAACPDGSMEDEFVQNLTAGAIYFLKDEDLFIDLKYDTGTMKFEKLRD